MNRATKVITKMTAAAAGLAGLLTTEALLIYHYGFEKADDALMEFWSKHNNTPEYAKDQIREGCRWLREMDVREVEVISFDGLTLRGHYLINPDAKRQLIAFHGYRSNAYYDFGALVRLYYEAGCSVLLVEQRGHRFSDGEHVSMGVLERKDVTTWVNYVNEVYGTETQIYLTGISMGAATILMAQDQNLPDNVRGMIADCGFSNTYEEVRYFGSHHGIILAKRKMPFIDKQCQKRAGFSLKEANPIDALKKAKIPVLFFHGTEDQLVPLQNGIDNYEACTAPKKLVLIEGAEHAHSCFVGRERYEQEVRDFFAQYDKKE